jgi:hypothetical protein
MYPSQHLIKSLRTVANKVLDTDSEWLFNDSRYCNCGLLAQELGIKKEQVPISGYWYREIEERKKRGEETCRETGLPLTSVFRVLASYGITLEELFELEMVGREFEKYYIYNNINSSSVPIYSQTEYRQVVANHFFQKADELEQQLNTLQQNHKTEKQNLLVKSCTS